MDDFKLQISIEEWIKENYESIPNATKSTLVNILIQIYNACDVEYKTNIITDLNKIIKINPQILEKAYYQVFKELREEKSDSTIKTSSCITRKALTLFGADKTKLITPTKKNDIDTIQKILPKSIEILHDDTPIKKFIIDRFNHVITQTNCKSKITKKTMLRYWANILVCFGDLKILDINNLDLSITNIVKNVKPIITSDYYIIYLHHLFYKITDEWDIKIKDLKTYFDIKEKQNDINDGDKDFLTVLQQENIWKACETTMEKLLVSLLFTTGMRIGGICNIKRNDVYDKNTNTIKDYGCTIEKGNKKRNFPIFFMVREHLEKWIKDTHMVETPYLFYNERDSTKPKGTSFFQTMFKKIAEKAGYKGSEIHVHAARHSVARNLLESGNRMDDISKFLGHANPATTSKFYANLSVQETVDRMNTACLGGENKKNSHISQVPNFETTEILQKEKRRKKNKLSKLANIDIMGKSANEEQLLKMLEKVRSNKV